MRRKLNNNKFKGEFLKKINEIQLKLNFEKSKEEINNKIILIENFLKSNDFMNNYFKKFLISLFDLLKFDLYFLNQIEKITIKYLNFFIKFIDVVNIDLIKLSSYFKTTECLNLNYIDYILIFIENKFLNLNFDLDILKSFKNDFNKINSKLNYDKINELNDLFVKKLILYNEQLHIILDENQFFFQKNDLLNFNTNLNSFFFKNDYEIYLLKFLRLYEELFIINNDISKNYIKILIKFLYDFKENIKLFENFNLYVFYFFNYIYFFLRSIFLRIEFNKNFKFFLLLNYCPFLLKDNKYINYIFSILDFELLEKDFSLMNTYKENSFFNVNFIMSKLKKINDNEKDKLLILDVDIDFFYLKSNFIVENIDKDFQFIKNLIIDKNLFVLKGKNLKLFLQYQIIMLLINNYEKAELNLVFYKFLLDMLNFEIIILNESIIKLLK